MWSPPERTLESIREINRRNIPYVEKEIETQYVIRCAFMNTCRDEQQLMYKNVSKNFTWLCKKHNTTRKRVLFDLENNFGITIDHKSYNEEAKKKLKSVSAPMIIAKYFNVSVKDLIFSDMETISVIMDSGVPVNHI